MSTCRRHLPPPSIAAARPHIIAWTSLTVRSARTSPGRLQPPEQLGLAGTAVGHLARAPAGGADRPEDLAQAGVVGHRLGRRSCSTATSAVPRVVRSERGVELGDPVLHLVPAELGDQRVLRREMPVERADADIGPAGDVVHLDVDPALAERLARAAATIRSWLRCASARSGRPRSAFGRRREPSWQEVTAKGLTSGTSVPHRMTP